MTISVDKSIYTVYPGEVVHVRFKVVNTWHNQFGGAFLNTYRLQLVSSYYNNGDRVNYSAQTLTPGYKREGTFKLNTPSSEIRYHVELRLQIKRASDGKFLTNDKVGFYIETKFDTPDIPDSNNGNGIPKAQILTTRTDKLEYKVGDIVKSESTIKNIGGDGIVYLKVGLGYLDSSNMIFLTGAPVDNQLFLRYQQFYTFKEDVKVNITDYYRQRGIGWAYLQQQMYLFSLAGHRETGGDIVWDTEKHIKIYIDEPEEFKDPTDLDESIIGDIGDTIEDAIPAFGGLGGLKWVYEKAKDIEHIPDQIGDMLRGEPKEEREPPDIMPFIYIGFAGLVGYLLLRSQ